MVYIHEGGVPGIASRLRDLLRNDFHRRLNVPLYQQFLPLEEQQKNVQMQQSQSAQLSEAPASIKEAEQVKASEPVAAITPAEPVTTIVKEPLPEPKEEIELSPSPVLSLYDLFEFTAEERTQITPKGGKRRTASSARQQPVQGNLFGEPTGTAQPSGKKSKANPNGNRHWAEPSAAIWETPRSHFLRFRCTSRRTTNVRHRRRTSERSRKDSRRRRT